MNITLRFDNALPTHFDARGELSPGICGHYCDRFVKDLASRVEGKYPDAEVYIVTEYALNRPYSGHSAVDIGWPKVAIEVDLQAMHDELIEESKQWAVF